MPIPNSAEFELELPFLLERRLIQGTHGVRICQAISQPSQTQNRIRLLQEQPRNKCHFVQQSNVTLNASFDYGVSVTLLQAAYFVG